MNENFESQKDTAVDILGYGLILALLLEGKWESKFTRANTEEIMSAVQDIFWKKLGDYGCADITDQGVEGVLIRLGDKISRLKHLRKGEGEKKLLVQLLERNGKCGIQPPAKMNDCAFDLYVREETIIPPHGNFPCDVSSKVAVKIPKGYWGLILGRSSTSRRLGINIVPGVIDNDYTGELFACCYNMQDKPVTVKEGMRLAQIILLPMFAPPLKFVDELPKTERGSTGFGSTGA